MTRRRTSLALLTAHALSTAHSVRCEIGSFDGASDTDAKWVHVAVEGTYLGYRGGAQPFAFTRKSFEQAVANIRTHPSFVAGANGEGSADVIPWDFNHASESDPTEGELPTMGAPSQAWTRDLKIVDANGKAHLYALTRFLEPARSYVKAGQYKWSSVAATFNGIDPVSGQSVGMVITSIALTNTPFIEGMEQLVASKNAPTVAQDIKAGRWFDVASTAEDALESFKQMLQLPVTSTLGDVAAEINKIAAWVMSGTTPMGVDVEDIVGSMRAILGLPALTAISAVLDNAGQIVQRFVEEQAVNSGQALAPTNNSVPAAAMAAAKRTGKMDLLKILASKLGVRENEEAVLAFITETVDLRTQLATLLASQDKASVLLRAAEEGAAARQKLTTLLQALGIEDAAGGVEKIAQLMASAESLKAAMPELEGLRAEKLVAEEKNAETDVEQAMASRGLKDPAVKNALLLSRKTNPAQFAKDFPVSAAPASNPAMVNVLTTPLLASRNGAEHTARSASITAAQAPSAQPVLGGNAPQQVNLSRYPGANTTQRAIAYLSATMDGFDKLSFDEQFKQALKFKSSPGVVD